MSADQSEIQRAIMPPPASAQRQQVFQDEWAVRYGVLMGGTAVVETPGIGEFWKGHNRVYRRRLTGFTTQQVRARNEAEDSAKLDEPGGALLGPTPLDSARIVDKSPALCMREMMMELGGKGFINLQTLLGDTKSADRLFNAVLPPAIADKPVVDVIEFLEQPGNYTFLGETLAERAELVREELLQGAYGARNYMQVYTEAVSEEIGQFDEKKTGKHRVDSVDREYFWELKKTLPENRRKETMTELGKEIAVAVKGGSDSAGERMAAAMEEQNRLRALELEIRQRELESTERLSAKRPSPQTK